MPQQQTIQPTITLDEIVDGYCSQHRRPEAEYFRISQLGIRGLRLFHRDSTGMPIWETLEVLGNNTSVLPVGALNKISCGVLNQRGEIASLTYDPILGLGESTNPNRLQQPTEHLLADNFDLQIDLQDNLNFGYPIAGYGQFGVGSTGTIGYYNIDWANRVMVFNFCHFCPKEVQFVYLGMPCEGGNYVIHPFFQEALIAYIRWQDSIGNPKMGNSRENKALFDLEYRNARFALTPFDPSDMYNGYRASVRLSPKA